MDARKHLLIVEDDAALREIMAVFLRGNGYRVGCAGNGLEALAYLRRQDLPHLIILDLHMAGLDGWHFRQLQREDSRLAPIPVVVVSGAADEPGNADGLEVAAYFQKPVDADELLATLGRLLSRGA
jgi:DNA-binding response OmpR family regulator